MKALGLLLLAMLTAQAGANTYQNADARCECSDNDSAGIRLFCEGRDIQFFPFKHSSVDAAKAKCEQARVEFLKADTHIVCTDPKGSPTKADLHFNNEGGTLLVTYPDGRERPFTAHYTDVKSGGTADDSIYNYEYIAYDATLDMEPPFVILEVYPKFYEGHDMDNKTYFDGYWARLGVSPGPELSCTVDDIL